MADTIYDPADLKDKPLAAKVTRGNLAVNKPEAVTVTGYEANVNGAGQSVLRLICYPVGKPSFQEAIVVTSDHLMPLMTAEQYDALEKQAMNSCDIDIELVKVAGFSLNPYRISKLLRGEIVAKKQEAPIVEQDVKQWFVSASGRVYEGNHLESLDDFGPYPTLGAAQVAAVKVTQEETPPPTEPAKPEEPIKPKNDWSTTDHLAAYQRAVEDCAFEAGVKATEARAWGLNIHGVKDETEIAMTGSEALKFIRAHMPKSEPAPEPKREVNYDTGEITTHAQPAALVPYQPSAVLLPVQAQWDVMRQQAAILLKSGFLPQSIKTVEQAIAIMMMGEALGVKPIVALSTINVIQGKPTIPPQLMLAKVRQSGQLEDLSVTDDGTACTVIMKRKGETPHTETFSMNDAGSMGLASKDNWKRQPAVMRKWRAISAACRVVFPDIIWGLYTPEEMNPDIVIED